MSAFTEPSSVPIHSRTTGTSAWTTGATRTSGGGGGGGFLREHAAPASRQAASQLREIVLIASPSAGTRGLHDARRPPRARVAPPPRRAVAEPGAGLRDRRAR